MRIDATSTINPVSATTAATAATAAPASNINATAQRNADPLGPAYIVSISAEGREAYEASVRNGAPRIAALDAGGRDAVKPLKTTQNGANATSFFDSVYKVSISEEGRMLYEADTKKSADNISPITGKAECETCKNRKYVDESGDATVSFQTPTHISPESAPSLVAAHEGEHVSNERAYAANEGRRIISQSVSIETSVCPECGRIYVSGGETRTVSVSESE